MLKGFITIRFAATIRPAFEKDLSLAADMACMNTHTKPHQTLATEGQETSMGEWGQVRPNTRQAPIQRQRSKVNNAHTPHHNRVLQVTWVARRWRATFSMHRNWCLLARHQSPAVQSMWLSPGIHFRLKYSSTSSSTASGSSSGDGVLRLRFPVVHPCDRRLAPPRLAVDAIDLSHRPDATGSRASSFGGGEVVSSQLRGLRRLRDSVPWALSGDAQPSVGA